MSILEIKNLTLMIGKKHIVKNLNWQINRGEKWVVIGENGVGKTTLLHFLMGLSRQKTVLKKITGDIFLNGENIETVDRQEKAKQMGLLEQKSAMSSHMLVIEIALMAYEPHRQGFWHSNAEVDIVIQALKKVALFDKQQLAISHLSGGEYQRLKIALLLIQNPNIMILDEVNTHLDIKHQMQLLSRLNGMQQSMIMSIHDLNLAYQFASHALLIHPNYYFIGAKQKTLTAAHLTKIFDYPIKQENNHFYYG